jgi:hypothetical protein
LEWAIRQVFRPNYAEKLIWTRKAEPRDVTVSKVRELSSRMGIEWKKNGHQSRTGEITRLYRWWQYLHAKALQMLGCKQPNLAIAEVRNEAGIEIGGF